MRKESSSGEDIVVVAVPTLLCFHRQGFHDEQDGRWQSFAAKPETNKTYQMHVAIYIRKQGTKLSQQITVLLLRPRALLARCMCKATQ